MSPGQIKMTGLIKMKLTGVRIEKAAEALLIRRLRVYSAAEYKARIAEINREQVRADTLSAKREAEAAKRAAKKEAEAAKKAAEKKEAARIARNARARERRALAKTTAGFLSRLELTMDYNMDAEDVPSEGKLANPAWQELAEKLMTKSTVRMLLILNGELVKESTGIILLHNTSWQNVYWRYIFPFLFPYDSRDVLDILNDYNEDHADHPADYISYVVTSNQEVPAEKLAQVYRDGGDVHCILDPLITLFKNMGDNSEKESSRKVCYRTMRRLQGLRVEYEKGVPESDMEMIAKIIQRKIVINDMFGKECQVYNSKSTKTFTWTNTREHHCDVGHLTLAGQAEKVTQDEFDEIHAKHQAAYAKKGEVYLMEGSSKGLRCIRSAAGAWRVSDPMFEAFEKITNNLKLNEYGVDCVKNPDLVAYIREATVVSAAPVQFSKVQPTGHRDLAVAYCQHELTPYYQGFLGKIQQARKLSIPASEARQFLADHIGIFRVRILSCKNPLLQRLGLKETVTLPSPELMYFIDNGVSVEIVSGVFGSKWTATKEELYDGLMEPIGKVKKPYTQFAGCFGHQGDTKRYTFNGSKEWASHLKSCGYKVFHDEGIISVDIPKDFYYTRHHILAFITSYTRINLLEAMSQFDIKNLVAVVLDGIYFTGDLPSISEEFKEKKIKPLSGCTHGWYMPSIMSDEFMEPLTDSKLLKSCILAGQGGSGKTHGVLIDSGFYNVLYVVPQHTLGHDKVDEFGTRYTTIHKLIGLESVDDKGKVTRCRPWKEENTMPAVAVLDELTMVEAAWVEKAIAMYPHTLFLIAGDVIRHNGQMIAMQCRSGRPGFFNKIFDGGLPIKYFTDDWRSAAGDPLRKIKLEIRKKMLELYTDGETEDARAMAMWVAQRFNVSLIEDVQILPGDTVIAGTHKTNDKLLAMGVVSGYLSPRKERSTEFVEGWKARGSFTTHSYQGSKIANGRVIVCINDSFELAMIYTAVSRAVRWDQIVFVVM
jgi:hypothetical protein